MVRQSSEKFNMATTAKKQPTTKKPTPANKPEKGYRDHLAGSRKGGVHEAFDKKGADAALALGIKLKLKGSTVKSWMGAWKRADANAAPKVSKAPKPRCSSAAR